MISRLVSVLHLDDLCQVVDRFPAVLVGVGHPHAIECLVVLRGIGRGGADTEVSEETQVENFWPWGPSAGDLNADGYEDLELDIVPNRDKTFSKTMAKVAGIRPKGSSSAPKDSRWRPRRHHRPNRQGVPARVWAKPL